MTVQEMIVQVYEELGAPTNLCPFTDVDDEGTFDITLQGSQKILADLNRGMSRIANWKFRNGEVLRLNELNRSKLIRFGTPYTGTAVSGAAPGTITIPGIGSDVDGGFDDWVIEITEGTSVGEKFRVLSSTVSGSDIIIEIEGEWETAPDNTSKFSLYKSWVEMMASSSEYLSGYNVVLDPVTDVLDLYAVIDRSTGTQLERTYNGDYFEASRDEVSDPTQFQVEWDKIYFDAALNEPRTFEIRYIRQPVKLTLAGQVPSIPEQYHEPVVLWAVRGRQRIMQAYDKAYATKREVVEMMEQMKHQGHHRNDGQAGGLVLFG